MKGLQTGAAGGSDGDNHQAITEIKTHLLQSVFDLRGDEFKTVDRVAAGAYELVQGNDRVCELAVDGADLRSNARRSESDEAAWKVQGAVEVGPIASREST